MVAGATTFAPLKRWDYGRWAVCPMILRVSVERSILSPGWGWPPQVANSAGEEQGHEMHCGRGRRLAVSYAIECHGGAMPRTPFCCFAALSLKGKQEIELENLCVKCALCHSGGSPLWWLAPPPLPRWEACHTILMSLALPYESCSLATPAPLGALWALDSVSQSYNKKTAPKGAAPQPSEPAR